jgi:hypothetical protein
MSFFSLGICFTFEVVNVELMNTIIEARQLNEELEELRCISESWISDLDLLVRDIEVLNLKCKSLVKVGKRGAADEDVSGFFERISKLDRLANVVKESALEHFASIVTLENDETAYCLSLIENHTRIELEVGALLNAYKIVNRKADQLFEG